MALEGPVKAGSRGHEVEDDEDSLVGRIPRHGQGAHLRQAQAGRDQGGQGVDGIGFQMDPGNRFLDAQSRAWGWTPQTETADPGPNPVRGWVGQAEEIADHGGLGVAILF